jgi:hypothetical protein
MTITQEAKRGQRSPESRTLRGDIQSPLCLLISLLDESSNDRLGLSLAVDFPGATRQP